jgi:hypothetical protein
VGRGLRRPTPSGPGVVPAEDHGRQAVPRGFQAGSGAGESGGRGGQQDPAEAGQAADEVVGGPRGAGLPGSPPGLLPARDGQRPG